eukprot:6190354-Pleurochrysis_carterae.AAC.2
MPYAHLPSFALRHLLTMRMFEGAQMRRGAARACSISRASTRTAPSQTRRTCDLSIYCVLIDAPRLLVRLLITAYSTRPTLPACAS